MKTSEFIAALAADPIPESVNIRRRFAAALAVGLVGALALYLLFIGPRPDIAEAVRTVRFNLKFLDALALALPSLLLLVRLARPDAEPGALALWLFAPLILLALAVVVELMVVPSDQWLPRLIGHNMRYCTTHDPADGRADPGGADRGDARRRAAASGLDRRAGGGGRGRDRLVPLRLALPRRFAALRRDLVPGRDPGLRRRGRARGRLFLAW